MRAGLIGLMGFMLLVFISSGVVAQDSMEDGNAIANITSSPESTTSSQESITSSPESVSAPAPTPAEPADIQGVWKVSLAGTDITMAVNQSGDSLFGQCKFEGDTPWNGVISGSVSGRIVNIAMAAMEGKVLACVSMSGTVADDEILGSYVRYDSSGTAAKGELTATRISTDTAEYTPAKVEAEVKAEAAQPSEQASINQAQQLGSTTQPSVTSSKGKYNDVTELAKGIDPNILPRHAQL